jgi:hypothetical protein
MMATKIYDTAYVYLIDETELYLTPLKIKYLREFMEAFENVKSTKNDNDAITSLVECARIAMKQYYPTIKTVEDVEDNFDLQSIYTILDIAGGIKVEESSEEPVKEQAVESGSSWDTFDILSLESEVFLLGIWKDYEELESSLSLPELTEILNTKREADYAEKKFLAAMQGVDLDKQSGRQDEKDPWEAMKARVFSGGQSTDPDDVVSLQGVNAAKAGFGIGNGLTYESWD